MDKGSIPLESATIHFAYWKSFPPIPGCTKVSGVVKPGFLKDHNKGANRIVPCFDALPALGYWEYGVKAGRVKSIGFN